MYYKINEKEKDNRGGTFEVCANTLEQNYIVPSLIFALKSFNSPGLYLGDLTLYIAYLSHDLSSNTILLHCPSLPFIAMEKSPPDCI